MSYSHSYLQSTISILSEYSGQEPFASYLKKYFAANKKFGSRDRKQVSHLCYSAFRLGKAGQDLGHKEKIIKGLFLTSSASNSLLNDLDAELNAKAEMDPEEKARIVDLDLSAIFPWKDKLSDGIEHAAFSRSFLVQPDLFIRIRPGFKNKVQGILQQKGIQHEFIGENSIRLPSSLKVEEYFTLDKEIVIQDLNSQQVGGVMSFDQALQGSVWDLCAASGGKSIMAHDINPEINLTVSDIRKSILVNLEKRFNSAGIKNYRSYVADLADPGIKVSQTDFDMIIADVPCSGSGTWGRTPEQLVLFDETRIDHYKSLQRKIIDNAVGYLKPGGHILYITCSVFREENEEQVKHLHEKFGLVIKKAGDLKGYQLKADSMYAALLQKN